jgi:hypothetical protein
MSDPAAPQSGPSGLPRAGRRTEDVAATGCWHGWASASSVLADAG